MQLCDVVNKGRDGQVNLFTCCRRGFLGQRAVAIKPRISARFVQQIFVPILDVGRVSVDEVLGRGGKAHCRAHAWFKVNLSLGRLRRDGDVIQGEFVERPVRLHHCLLDGLALLFFGCAPKSVAAVIVGNDVLQRKPVGAPHGRRDCCDRVFSALVFQAAVRKVRCRNFRLVFFVAAEP